MGGHKQRASVSRMSADTEDKPAVAEKQDEPPANGTPDAKAPPEDKPPTADAKSTPDAKATPVTKAPSEKPEKMGAKTSRGKQPAVDRAVSMPTDLPKNAGMNKHDVKTAMTDRRD